MPETTRTPHTLFNAPQVEPQALAPGMVGVVGMPSDWTHSSRIGTRFGPAALRRATSRLAEDRPTGLIYDADRGVFEEPREGWIADCGDAAIDPANVMATTEAIAAMTQAVSAAGAIPLALGGDHYNSFPACLGVSRALAEQAPGQRFGYIQIDGHLDFSATLGAWGTHNHATNARRISELPNVTLRNMVWIGISGWVDAGDVAAIEAGGGKIFSSGDVHTLGPDAVAQAALEHALAGVDLLYLSIDIDAMDAGFLPGTGSIVHSGITPQQYYAILDALAPVPIAGLDIVEVSPPLDPTGRSEFLAAEMLFRVLAARRARTVVRP